LQSSIQAIQHSINAQVAARTGAVTSDPNALSGSRSPPEVKTYPDEALKAYYQQQKGIKQLSRSGTDISGTYSPSTIITDPPKAEEITLPQLLANQTHLGHHTSLWNPANSSYIEGTRQGIHIISLDITYAYLTRAAKVIREVARRGGLILFVGTRRGHEEIIVRAARRAQGYHIFDRWVPGTLTNGQQLLSSCAVKVVDINDNEIPMFRELLNKGKHSVIKPDLVVCLNPLENEVCLHECGLNDVPTIGIIDTDANPAWVTYPIPANDDSLRSVALVAGVLSQAAKQGQQMRLAAAREGKATYSTLGVKRWLAHTNEVAALNVDEGTGERDTEGDSKET
jgi:small subunit ribosomal protein S2